MNKKSTVIVTVIVAVSSLLGLNTHASPATPVSSTPPPAPPPSACFSDYLESKDNFYATFNGGAIFFDGPIKDQSNIYSGNGTLAGFPSTAHPVGASSTDDTTGSVGGTFGYVFDRHPQEDWLGHNLRAEAGADYYQTSASSTSSVNTAGNGYLAVGRLDGQNFTNFNPVIAAFNQPNTVANVSFIGHDEVYDANLVVKSDYGLAQNAFVFTPEVGLGFARLEQRSSTDASGFYAGSTFANEQESITTDYYGAILGFELKANVSKQFVPFISAVTTLGYADSTYFGAQEYASNFNPGSFASDSASDSRGDFFAREQLNGGAYYDFGPVILKVSGGLDYWSNVAAVQEATVPNGSALANNNPNVAPSHLRTVSMANPQANVSIIVPF